ncbi:aminoacyl-tRNA deacylase [Mesorhizobium sp.]|uniref:aminoacyl-tRNA deacylase n=1 Tax=Mesorhizobium sp. TaxID=1871066 RepID=UPI0025DC094F|nr:YbaK/EbsC family protein [Mesorhizobium sp.]
MSPAVKRFLEERGARYAVETHAPLISFEDARTILSLDPEKMVKGLTFARPGGFAIVALRAADRADYKKIADALGLRRADLWLADAELVRKELDMEQGGIVPLPIASARVLIDRAVLGLDEIICGTGRNTATLIIERDVWLGVADGEVGDFAKATPATAA